MIRINLLGVPKKTTRGGRRASTVATSGGGEGSSTVILGLIFAGALVVLIGLAHMWVQREHDVLEKNLQKAVLENQRLADVKAKYEASKKKADMYERRVRVIDELKSAQSGPVDLLNLVADTINSTDAVWLETMTNDGKTLNFTGMALSPNSVADLMSNLRKTGAFRTVEIKETAQDNAVKEVKDADQFIKLLHDTAATSGIEIRRYTAMPVSNKEFYSEVPFAIDIDGPYYSVLNFFQRVAELERIVNVGNMQMGNTKKGSEAKVKGGYTYAPGETVLASCTATTFFSHDPEEQPAPGPPKPGQSAAAPTAKP